MRFGFMGGVVRHEEYRLFLDMEMNVVDGL